MRQKPETAQYRRAYFAMLPIVGIDARDDEARHRFNLELVGKESTQTWTLGHWSGNRWVPGDWDIAVSGLQRSVGMEGVELGFPHLKGTWLGAERPSPLDVGATDRQMRMIESLAAQMDWRHPGGPAAGLEALIRKRVLRLGTSAEIQWHGSLATLDRKQASLTIIILDREPKVARPAGADSPEVARLSETDSLPPADAGDCRLGEAAHGFSPFLAREGDPETSQDAASAAVASGLVALYEKAIVEALSRMRDGGTGKEIADALRAEIPDADSVKVMRRISALLAAGKAHRLPDPAAPDDPKKCIRRDGQAVHFYGPAGMPLQNAAKVPV